MTKFFASYGQWLSHHSDKYPLPDTLFFHKNPFYSNLKAQNVEN